MSESIPIQTAAWLWGIGIVAALLATITVSLWLAGRTRPGRVKPVAVFLGYLIIGGVSAFLLLAMAINRIEVGADTVLIRGGAVYSRSVAARELVAGSVRTHPPAPWPGLSLRTNGIGMPGYAAGWFRDRDGATTFVVYGGGSAVSFQTSDGTRHLIGTAQPQQLAAAIAAMAPQ